MVNDLKSNELMVMTRDMHRAFNAAGCDPACHCCNNKIPVGDYYKLASVSSALAVYGNAVSVFESQQPFKTTEAHEVMLCASIKCTPDEMVKRRYKEKADRVRLTPYRSGGCSIINGKIVA